MLITYDERAHFVIAETMLEAIAAQGTLEVAASDYYCPNLVCLNGMDGVCPSTDALCITKNGVCAYGNVVCP